MEKFEKLTAVAAPMPASNIDTDIIMPKAFLKRIDKEGVLYPPLRRRNRAGRICTEPA